MKLFLRRNSAADEGDKFFARRYKSIKCVRFPPLEVVEHSSILLATGPC